ncbi:hypothetical protein BGZ99_005430 [Dissophora globulifera]|uniref:Transmembrane protein 223 n=1 Tax=Dissophora globulifera TaxID=979702 RepID=A0A9P6RH20_9FUNG|nr:hypothetical protein BGZ99_005430 [Dissophora globulifera]
MHRIQRLMPTGLCSGRISYILADLPVLQHSSQACRSVRFYASGSRGGGGASAKKSPFKYSHPDSKNQNAVQSPTSLSTSAATATATASSTAAATAKTVAAREAASKGSRRGGSGNFSRTLADMCAKQDVLFYEPPALLRKTFLLAYATAGLQLLFWGNIAQYAFTHYTDNPIFMASQPPPPPLPLPGTEGVESTDVPLAPLRTRIIISAGLIGTGLVIAFGICAIPWRYVTKLTFLRGGTQIRIDTGRKFPPGYHRLYSIQDMQCRQPLVTGVGPQGTLPVQKGSSVHIMLGSKKERMAFFVDRRGSFKDPALWDKVFHRPY